MVGIAEAGASALVPGAAPRGFGTAPITTVAPGMPAIAVPKVPAGVPVGPHLVDRTVLGSRRERTERRGWHPATPGEKAALPAPAELRRVEPPRASRGGSFPVDQAAAL
ncbi:hypothetical protein GCM10010251_59270 [Streptomyces aurantiogriseus]|uniref:Uncharacterized protein n=1 Tax=Streptomyces aurantiogriseus TaxID=66870 RepID=A0A918FFQ7_9ACTN|nr:hypothetical protein GCM10010251_59270 [Streptomyces aurantiogriseus]